MSVWPVLIFSVSCLFSEIDFSLTPADTTLAPALASFYEAALPMPVPAPVTIATFPVTPFIFSSFTMTIIFDNILYRSYS
jgi:hypothetical protein